MISPHYIILDTAKGKVLKDHWYDLGTDSLVLSFEDGSFTVLNIQQGYECEHCVDNPSSPRDIEEMLFGLLDHGVFNEDDAAAIRKDFQARRDQNDRREYDRLRRKFERGDNPLLPF